MYPTIPALPEELYSEIAASLWDDVQSLKSCSLATRKMTLTGQKLLFRSVTLRAGRNLLREEYAPGAHDSSGTSADLLQLLTDSSHIARYIRSIHIIDLEAQYALVNDVVESVEGDPSASGIRRWLPNDRSLPRCAPMFCNLKTLNISYDACWHQLSGRVLNSLIDLLGQPSVDHVRVGDHIPSFILNFALSPHIKHLKLPHLGRMCSTLPLVKPPREPVEPVYLESLSIDRPFAFVALLSAPTSRLLTGSSLRSLFVRSPNVEEHAIIWQFLQSCLDTLEDFEFNPTQDVGFPALIPFEELIDLGKIVSLKNFAACLLDNDETNYTPWFNRIISSASGNRHLEEICLNMIYVGDGKNPTWWRGAFDALLQGEFKSLKRLRIFLQVDSMSESMSESVYGNDLNGHEGLKQLQYKRGVAVEIYFVGARI